MVLLHAETFQNPCTLILLLVVVVVRAAPAVQPTVTVQLTVQPTDSGEPRPAYVVHAWRWPMAVILA